MNPIRKYLHYIGAVITFLAGIAAAIASVRYIVVDAQVSTPAMVAHFCALPGSG